MAAFSPGLAFLGPRRLRAVQALVEGGSVPLNSYCVKASASRDKEKAPAVIARRAARGRATPPASLRLRLSSCCRPAFGARFRLRLAFRMFARARPRFTVLVLVLLLHAFPYTP